MAVCVHTLGFWPHNSLVLLTVGSPGLGPLLRIDLPGGGSEDSREYFDFFVSQLPHHKGEAGAYNRLFAVFFGNPVREGEGKKEPEDPSFLGDLESLDYEFIDRVQDLIQPLHSSVVQQSVDLIDVIAVGQRSLWSLHLPELTLLPATSTSSVVRSSIYREMLAQGSDVAAHQQDFLDRSRWDPLETADVSRRDGWLTQTEFAALGYLAQKTEKEVSEYQQIRAELMIWDAALHRCVGVILGHQASEENCHPQPHISSCGDGKNPSPADLLRSALSWDVGAYLIASLDSTATLQLVIYLACTGVQQALSALESIGCRLDEAGTLNGDYTHPVLPLESTLNNYGIDRPNLLGQVQTGGQPDDAPIASMASKLCGHDAEAPNWDRLAALCAIATVLEDAAHHKPESLLKIAQAWAYWLQGKSTLADYLLTTVEPFHHGNEPTVLHRVLDAGVLPTWLSARPQPNIQRDEERPTWGLPE